MNYETKSESFMVRFFCWCKLWCKWNWDF